MDLITVTQLVNSPTSTEIALVLKNFAALPMLWLLFGVMSFLVALGVIVGLIRWIFNTIVSFFHPHNLGSVSSEEKESKNDWEFARGMYNRRK